MKRTQQIITLCALAALPTSALATPTAVNTPSEITSKEVETQTTKLTVTGMH